MGVELFEFLIILSSAILVLSFVRCLISHDMGHDFNMNQWSNIVTPSDFSFRMEVYYEALDVNSKAFIAEQLLPIYDKIKEATNIVLIPYGKTQMFHNSNGSYEIRCEHGPIQCEANLQHACIVDIVDDVHLKLHLIGCLFSYHDTIAPREAFVKCSQEHQLPLSDIIQLCAKSNHGMKLLQRYGERTMTASKRRLQTPFIVLNGSVELEANSSVNLSSDIYKFVGMSGKLNETYM